MRSVAILLLLGCSTDAWAPFAAPRLIGAPRAVAKLAKAVPGWRAVAPLSRNNARDAAPFHAPGTLTTARAAAAAAPVEKEGRTLFETYTRVSTLLTNLFPLWTVLFSGWALARPSAFAWLTTEYFTAGLATLMLSMGITLAPSDFVRVASRPNAVLLNFLACYGMMPVLGVTLGKLFGLDPALVAGMVLVGSINGGQASNLCTFIANGNVALSVLMTTATTIGAIFMTPFLCQTMLGAVVPVDAAGIVVSTLQVVLAPIAVGMLANKYANRAVKAVLPVTPLIGVASTCLLVASAVGQVAAPIKAAGLGLQVPVALLHILGGLVGYFATRALGFGETTARTMAIETSMKSSAFGFLLAKLHFGSYAARVPAAVSVVWMALTGSVMAVIWRYIPVKPAKFDRKVKERFEAVDIVSIIKKALGGKKN